MTEAIHLGQDLSASDGGARLLSHTVYVSPPRRCTIFLDAALVISVLEHVVPMPCEHLNAGVYSVQLRLLHGIGTIDMDGRRESRQINVFFFIYDTVVIIIVFRCRPCRLVPRGLALLAVLAHGSYRRIFLLCLCGQPDY